MSFIEEIQNQLKGDYYHVISDSQKYMLQGNIINFIQGVEIRMTEDRGRGVFATKDLKRGELIVVDKAIAEVTLEKILIVLSFTDKKKEFDGSHTELVKQCQKIALNKGNQALIMSYLFDDRDKRDLKIPPLDIFLKNEYK